MDQRSIRWPLFGARNKTWSWVQFSRSKVTVAVVLLHAFILCFALVSRASAQSPRVLYTWQSPGDTLNWFKNFGTNDVAIANDTAGQLTISETGTAGSDVAISDAFNTISESAAELTAGGIDLTGLDALEFDMGHDGNGTIDVQFFVQADAGSSFVPLGPDQAVAAGIATYSLPLVDLTPDQRAFVRTVGFNVRAHEFNGNVVWTVDEVRSSGTPLARRDFATHDADSSDQGLQGAIVNFGNGAVEGNDGGQNQTGLSQNLGPDPPGNSGALHWVDLAGQGGAAVSYGNGTAFGGNTFSERPTDMSNYNAVRVRLAATNRGGSVDTVDVQYFLQTGNFVFQEVGIQTLPADGTFYELTFPLSGVTNLDVVMQHGINLGEHETGDLIIDIDNLRALLLGDVNADGAVNGLDVDPFVQILLNGPYDPNADMNGDQFVNGLDVDPFVTAVVGGGAANDLAAATVPEPTGLLLATLALVGLFCQTRS